MRSNRPCSRSRPPGRPGVDRARSRSPSAARRGAGSALERGRADAKACARAPGTIPPHTAAPDNSARRGVGLAVEASENGSSARAHYACESCPSGFKRHRTDLSHDGLPQTERAGISIRCDMAARVTDTRPRSAREGPLANWSRGTGGDISRKPGAVSIPVISRGTGERWWRNSGPPQSRSVTRVPTSRRPGGSRPTGVRALR